jgi:hypothetical protein
MRTLGLGASIVHKMSRSNRISHTWHWPRLRLLSLYAKAPSCAGSSELGFIFTTYHKATGIICTPRRHDNQFHQPVTAGKGGAIGGLHSKGAATSTIHLQACTQAYTGDPALHDSSAKRHFHTSGMAWRYHKADIHDAWSCLEYPRFVGSLLGGRRSAWKLAMQLLLLPCRDVQLLLPWVWRQAKPTESGWQAPYLAKDWAERNW